MAEQGGRAGGGVAAPGATGGAGPLGAVLLAFEQTAVTLEAARVREAGIAVAHDAAGLVAALEEASAAAAGMGVGGIGALLTGPALAECAALLARRARDLEAGSARTAEAMARAVGLLTDADEEVAGRVAGAAG